MDFLMRIFELKKKRMIIAFSTGILCLIVLICLFSPDTFAATPEEIKGFTNGETIIYEGGTILSDLPEELEGVVPDGTDSDESKENDDKEPAPGESPEDGLSGTPLLGSANPNDDSGEALKNSDNESKNGDNSHDAVKNGEKTGNKDTDNSRSDSDGVKTESGSAGQDDNSAGSTGESTGSGSSESTGSDGSGESSGSGSTGESTGSGGESEE